MIQTPDKDTIHTHTHNYRSVSLMTPISLMNINVKILNIILASQI